MLRVGLRAADAVVSVDRRSFPLESPKVARSVTASTSTTSRASTRHADDAGLRVLSLGRYSTAKGIDTVVRAVAMTPGTS